LAVLATFLALYEFFFSHRVAPTFLSTGHDCTEAGAAEEMQRLLQFQGDHSENVIYLNLRISHLVRCEGGDFVWPDNARGVFLGRDQRFQMVPPVDDPRTLQLDETENGYTSYLSYNLDDLDDVPISRVILRDAGAADHGVTERLEGLFFLSRDAFEGTNWFELRPAPYDAASQRMLHCTMGLQSDSLRYRIGAYISSCILN
jgi:hypothetical protein